MSGAGTVEVRRQRPVPSSPSSQTSTARASSITLGVSRELQCQQDVPNVNRSGKLYRGTSQAFGAPSTAVPNVNRSGKLYHVFIGGDWVQIRGAPNVNRSGKLYHLLP